MVVVGGVASICWHDLFKIKGWVTDVSVDLFLVGKVLKANCNL